MPVPQVNERMKEAPAKALRAVFAGIGQVLSITDKLRGKPAPSPGSDTVAPDTVVGETKAPETGAAETDMAETVVVAESAAPEAAAAQTSAPEPVAPEPIAPEFIIPESVAAEPVAPEPKAKAAAKPRTAAKPAAAAPVTPGGHVRVLPPDSVPAAAPAPAAAPVPDAAPAAAADSAAPTAELPLANYDELTIASLRARLRNLSADQLGQLIEYEKSHAARPDVITMFERRVAKLAEA
jgi:hypothetical protein